MIETNLIPFDFSTGEVRASFFKDIHNNPDKEDYSPLSRDEFPIGLLQKHNKELEGVRYLYTDFKVHPNADFTGKVILENSPHFAVHYARYVIQKHLYQNHNLVVSRNLTKDVEAWAPEKLSSNTRWTMYYCFTVKVQRARMTNQYELVVSYDGLSRKLNTPIAELTSIDKSHFTRAIYNGKLHSYQSENSIVKNNEGNAYPVMNKDLERDLNIPRIDKPEGNKYERVQKMIFGFCKRYIFDSQLDDVISIPLKNQFLVLGNTDYSTLPAEASNLIFRDNKGIDIIQNDIVSGFKKGPYSNVTDKPLKIFFIYQDKTGLKAKDFVLQAFTKGALPDTYNGCSYMKIKPMHQAIRQSFTYEKDSDIAFGSLDTAIDEVEQALSKASIETEKYHYLAIYVSPISKNNCSDKHYQIVYAGIKEACLNKEVSVQGYFEQRLADEYGIQYSFTNLYAAILAKIGGIPWKIIPSTPDDLIIGVGAYYSRKKNKRYLAGAFCFDGSGIMREFACIEEREHKDLIAKIKNALHSFLTNSGGALPNRIVIHFYKEMKKADWKPIFEMLRDFDIRDIPVIVVTLSKSETKDIIGFSKDCKDLMPLAGTYFKVGERTWLLYNNMKTDQESWDKLKSRKTYHFPIKIKLDCRNADIMNDEGTVADLIQQVFQLSRMFWKTVDQQNLPITVKYPAILTEFLPYFRYEEIPNPAFGCKSLWFL